ncbi:MAG: CgeB family protein [Bacillota bacterium]
MRILYLESHPMFTHGLPKGFQDLGHEVKISGTLTKKDVLPMISGFNPDLIFAIGWTGKHSFINKQLWIGEYIQKLNIPYIYWATEDPGYTKKISLPIIRNGKPDFIFTICPQKIKYYESLGFQAAHLDFGYHPSVHTPVLCHDQYCSTIALVANGYSQLYKENPKHLRFYLLRTLVKPLLENGFRIDFYGHDWEHAEIVLDCSIPQESFHGYLPYTEANKVYSSTNIVIGLQNRFNQLTQRTYEVLASGGFLLTGDTPAVRSLFTPGKDLVVSSSEKETVRLVHYFLEKRDERRKIQKNGRNTVTKYSYKNRAKYVLQVLQKHNIL